jgi:hopene-associated glycosyltransferase HpnB
VTALVIASLACVAWAYLLLFRGGFWRAAERDDEAIAATPTPDAWPRVVAIVPARNEAELIAASVGSLLRQDYRGAFEIVVVDDHSSDATATLARAAAAKAPAAGPLTVLSAPELPDGWTGKLWAMQCGTAHADSLPQPPDYLLFSDADIGYTADTLTMLALRAQRDGLVLTSLMAKLHCESFGERALIPAFIFFFQLLYPFAWVNRPSSRTAAAAGGCMLVRRDALTAAGGIASIRGELIDDCALAARLKKHGTIHLALTDRARSLRAFRTLGDVRPMISRSAYAQLRYSPWLLAGTVLAMSVTCLLPPLVALGTAGASRWLAAAAWAAMALAMQPTLAFHRVSRWWGWGLPAIALVYVAFTLDSAYQHWRGRGGMWKGRAQGQAAHRG